MAALTPTEAAYVRQLKALLPGGVLWNLEPDSILTALVSAVAGELARVDARSDDLVNEEDPRTAVETLSDWERVLGLPDACLTVIPSSTADRQAAIVRRLTARGGQSAAYFLGLAAARGFIATVDEPTTHAWRLTSDLLHSSSACEVTYFRASVARAGDRVVSRASPELECVIGHAQPAHANAIFRYLAAGRAIASPTGAAWLTWDVPHKGYAAAVWCVDHFIGVGYDDENDAAIAATSTADGSLWTRALTSFPLAAFSALATSGPVTVAVGAKWASGAERGFIASSSDGGATWIERTDPASNSGAYTAVVATSSGFVATGYSNAAQDPSTPTLVIASTDGATWTQRASLADPSKTFDTHVNALAANGATVVGIGDAAWVSTDGGVTFAPRYAAGTGQAVLWDGSQWVAVGNRVVTSPDGNTWTTRFDVPGALSALAGNHANLVAAGADSSATPQGLVYTSSDGGLTWTQRGAPSDLVYNALAWSGAIYLGVGAVP